MRQLSLLFLAMLSLFIISGCRSKAKSTQSRSASPRGASVADTKGFFATPSVTKPVASVLPATRSVLTTEAVHILAISKPLLPEMILDLSNSKELKLVLIPKGKFRMGSTFDSDEQPIHDVRIVNPFYMGVSEVTQSQYQAVMGSNPSKFQGAEHPVVSVSWSDAISFCERLSLKSGKTVRLPSEAEWEYACRSGSTTKYCFGDDASQLGEYAWHNGNSRRKTHPVMKKKPNAWGLYDMYGNAWEWCQDCWHYSYNDAPNDGSARTTGEHLTTRVLRGSSSYINSINCRSANRSYNDSSIRYGHYGFRVVISGAP